MRLLLLAIILTLPVSLNAHRQHFGWTDIERLGQELAITHRVHAHDAVLWLERNEQARVDITSLESQARFALYTAEQFSFNLDNKTAELELIGAELDGPYLLIYQSLALNPEAKQLSIDSELLMDLYDDQLHILNLKLNSLIGIKGEILEFDRHSQAKTIELNAASLETKI